MNQFGNHCFTNDALAKSIIEKRDAIRYFLTSHYLATWIGTWFFHWRQRHRDFKELKQGLLGNSNSLGNNSKTKWPLGDRGWNTPSYGVPIARTYYYSTVDAWVWLWDFLEGDISDTTEDTHQPSSPSRALTGTHLWAWSISTNFLFIAQMWPRADQGELLKPVFLAIPGGTASLCTGKNLIRMPRTET